MEEKRRKGRDGNEHGCTPDCSPETATVNEHRRGEMSLAGQWD